MSLALPITKAGTVTQNFIIGMVKGHSRSSAVLLFDRSQDFLLGFHINNVLILYHFRDTVRDWSKISNFSYPTCLFCLALGCPD